MSDKQVKVAKPEKVKPQPVKPAPTKPNPIKPHKADGGYTHKHCVRCDKAITENSGVVRMLCSACDLDLQIMHWEVEHILFNKTTYMPEKPEELCSAKWFMDNGYAEVMRKASSPRRRNFFKHPPNEAMAM